MAKTELDDWRNYLKMDEHTYIHKAAIICNSNKIYTQDVRFPSRRSFCNIKWDKFILNRWSYRIFPSLRKVPPSVK